MSDNRDDVPSFTKHPDEVLSIEVDFTNRLAAGETIVSASAAVVAPGTITAGTVTPASPTVGVLIGAGTDGNTDSFKIDAHTNGNEILSAVVDVVVDARKFMDRERGR